MNSGKNKSSEKKSNKSNMNNKHGMYYAFKLIHNGKVPACKWTEHKNQKKICIQVNNDRNLANLGIPTGKRNNLCVIDIDCTKDENMFDNVFFLTFGDPENWFKLFGCPVVRTQSGGYHLYFQDEPRVLQTQNAETHIDVRAEGGYIVAPGSKINQNKYEIVQGDIGVVPTMNETLIKFMEYNYVGSKNSDKKKATIRTKIIKSKNGKEIVVQEVIGCDQSLYNYDYSDYMLNNIIKGLDKKYFNDYHYWLIFTTAMKQIDRQDLWIEYSKKYAQKEYNELYNLDIWNGIKQHRTIMAFNHILIQSKYKNARTTLDYYKYKKTLENKIKADLKINRNKLGINEQGEQEDYFNKLKQELFKIIVIKSDTGTGKTTAFKKYMKNRKGRKFLSLVSRKTLAQEQFNIFNEYGIECHHYLFEQFEDENYICQIDSIMKLGHAINENWFSDYDILLDEWNSIVKYIFTSSTLNKTRILVIEKLIDILQQAETIWCIDADISDSCLMFLRENVDTDMNKTLYVDNTFQHNKNTEAEELYSYENIVEKMKDETEMMICCDEARTCHLIENELKQHENKKDKKIIVIDRLTDETILENLDLDEYDIVIFSPKIIYGLDSTRSRPVFAIYRETTIDPKDMVQQINRCRSITKLWFYFERKTCYECEFNTFQDCIDDTKNMKKWCDKQDHLHMEMIYSGKMYMSIFNRFKYDEDAFKTNPSAHFRKIIKSRGFKVQTHIAQSKAINPKLKDDKNRRIENITPEDAYVQEQNKFLYLSDKDIMEHAEIFLESSFITQFLNSKLYLFNEYGTRFNPEKNEWCDDFKEVWCPETEKMIVGNKELTEKERSENFIEKLEYDVRECQDYDVKKIRSAKSKMLFIHELRQAIKLPNKFTIENPTLMDVDTADKLWSKYQATYSSQAKHDENPFYTEKGIQDIMCKMYKNLFGCAPFQGKEKKSTVDGVRKSEYIYKDNFDNKKFSRMKTIYFKHKKGYVQHKLNELNPATGEPYHLELDDE